MQESSICATEKVLRRMKPLSSQIIESAITRCKLTNLVILQKASEYASLPSTAIFDSRDLEKIGKGQIISRTAFDKFKQGKGEIRQDVCKVFCHVLNFDINEILMLSASHVKNGQGEIPQSRTIFNDYEGDRCLDEIWVDPLPMYLGHGGVEYGYIHVHLIEDYDKSAVQKKYISLIFKRQGWGCNVTLRPSGESAITTKKFNSIKFKLRSPERNHQINHVIGVRVRLVDAQNIIWCYGTINKQQVISNTINSYVEKGIYYHENLSVISNNHWKTVEICLKKENYFDFIYDGEAPIRKFPDFSEIKLITFDVGFEDSNEADEKCPFSGFSRQDTREGELHISTITFF